jgi:hypothetical protein
MLLYMKALENRAKGLDYRLSDATLRAEQLLQLVSDAAQ